MKVFQTIMFIIAFLNLNRIDCLTSNTKILRKNGAKHGSTWNRIGKRLQSMQKIEEILNSDSFLTLFHKEFELFRKQQNTMY